MKETDLRYVKTERAIRDAFFELLEESDFDKVSVTDITQRAQINRNTFYYYYQDMFALVDELLKLDLESIVDRHRTAELLCGFPPVLVGIRPTSPLFHFLAHIQEEVHRFAVSFHRQKRSKAFIHSELEQIEGVGDKTIQTLLRHFRTVERSVRPISKNFRRWSGRQRRKKSGPFSKNSRIF